MSGNPGGRPRVDRTVSSALAELQDTAGDDVDAIVKNFKDARGARFCGADLKAIAAFKREMSESSVGVSQSESTLDRLEGKVTQPTSLSIDLRDAASKLAQELDVPVEEVLERVQRIASGEKS